MLFACGSFDPSLTREHPLPNKPSMSVRVPPVHQKEFHNLQPYHQINQIDYTSVNRNWAMMKWWLSLSIQ